MAAWSPGINLILGRNGAGKTNLLEALSIITGWGAFGKTSGVVSWQNQTRRAYIGAEISGEESLTVSAEISSRISLRLNDKSVSFTELRTYVPSVLFLSGSLSLIDGPPSARRMFVDRLCALFVPPFAKWLADFKSVFRARSLMLRQGKNHSVTDEAYCRLGGWIMNTRRAALGELVKMIPPGKLSLDFVPAMNAPGSEYLREMSAANSERERYAQRPLFGPGYDDLVITVADTGRPASESLSRGQKRRLVLYLLLTAGRLIAERMGREPVLLLDDITAELDREGREFAYRKLEAAGWQVFLTAPEKPFATRRKFGGIELS